MKLPMIYEMGNKTPLTKSNTVSMFIYMSELSHSYNWKSGRKYGRITFYDNDEIVVTYRVLPSQYDAMRELIEILNGV